MSKAEENWIENERKRAEDYLRKQHIDHLGVGDYPAFHVIPYFALWAVQSKKSTGRIGWWIVTGDLPADCISANDGRYPREALRRFAGNWQEMSDYMLRGEAHPYYHVGTPDQWPELGNLLRLRAEIVRKYADDDAVWPDDVA